LGVGIAFLVALALLILAAFLLGWVLPGIIQRSRARKDALPPNTD
jgi:hypothetical protein